MSQKVCPSCNAPNDVNAGFCGSCGAPMNQGQAAAPTPPSYQPPTPPSYQPPTPPSYQPPAPSAPNYAPPAPQGYQAPAQAGNPGYQQQGYGYAPGMDADSARAYQAAQSAGLVIPAGYAPAGFWPRVGAYLIDGLIVTLFAWIPIIGWLAAIAYFIFFWGAKGQTPGKMALGLYVISADGQPMSYGKAALRYVGYMVSGFILGIGFLMVAFDDAKRGLHDRIATTLVVKKVG